MQFITWSAHQYYGSGRPWVARIAGTDEKYGYARAFVRGDTSRSRSGASGDTTWTIAEPGLYECRFPRRNKDDGGWRLVWRRGDELAWCEVDDARARAIIVRMDHGESFEAARLATEPKTEVRS